MDLIFEKQGKKWVAEFKVTSDFNLHIEREEKGFLFVQQRTPDVGEYDSVNESNFSPSDGVIDMDFVALVYPKWIKVVSEAEVTRAVVLPEGVAKQIAAVKTKYDGSIYEDRKALYDYYIALLPENGGEEMDVDLTLINFRDSELSIKINHVRRSSESVLSFWGEYENGDDWQYDMIGAENNYEFIYLD